MKTRKSKSLDSLIHQHRRNRSKRWKRIEFLIESWSNPVWITATTAFGVVGYLILVITPIPLIVADNRPEDANGGITALRMFGGALNAVAALLWISSGILCWRRKWLPTGLCAVIGLCAFVTAMYLLADVNFFYLVLGSTR
ncbi:MAG: hypothetical protein ABGX07_00430 [Pirellulaceae bacterium]